MTKKKEKQLRRITGHFYGLSDEFKGEIQVNVELIWQLTKDEDKFIKIFSQTYVHELLHLLIGDIIGDLFYYKEERVIRKILGEEWNKELDEYYKNMSRR